jgi:hypothetical protein
MRRFRREGARREESGLTSAVSGGLGSTYGLVPPSSPMLFRGAKPTTPFNLRTAKKSPVSPTTRTLAPTWIRSKTELDSSGCSYNGESLRTGRTSFIEMKTGAGAGADGAAATAPDAGAKPALTAGGGCWTKGHGPEMSHRSRTRKNQRCPRWQSTRYP